ncbi:hypothetical protein BC629DRAFT_1196020 [Irpex lacteus]|nr:hypothetical protein BC629DRAFT_1196020 [Irpex lacteus]
MGSSIFSLADYLQRRIPLHDMDTGHGSCLHASVVAPRLPSPAPDQYSHVIKWDLWFDGCIDTLSESVQVAQYECLDFPREKLQKFETSSCLVDKYAGPVIEIMNSIFLMEGHSPLVVTKETLTVDDEYFESFTLLLQNPERTSAPIYTTGQAVEHWPCGVFGMFLVSFSCDAS